MKTEKMGEIYQQIAEGINEIIPSEWERVILYAEILDDSSEVFFYFNTPHSEDFIYSLNIPDHYHVSEEIYGSYYLTCMTYSRNYEMNLKKTIKIYGLI